MRAFAEAFAPHGFRSECFLPCYGLAEATLFVAGGRAPDGWRTSRPAGFSRDILGYALRPEAPVCILGSDGLPIPDGAVGEIAVAGSSVSGCRRDASPAPTGDLGFLQDGFLHVTGRSRDLIILNGVNYYPDDLEAAIRAAGARARVGRVACFSVVGRPTERLIVALETQALAKNQQAELVDTVRTRLADAHGVLVDDVVLVRMGSLPRASNGKIARSDCRDAYLSGTLEPARTLAPADAPRNETSAPSPSGQREDRTANLAPDGVAVIGMACRFPGGAVDLESYWELLARGGDAIVDTPPERWDTAQFYDPRPAIPGKMNTRWGGFLADIDRFDADFFGIAPREAAEMDPQQRLLLEVAWRAFENAGLSVDDLAGRRVGVFVGLSTNDYLHLQIKLKTGIGEYNAFSGLGNADSIAANRISYLFDLRGPSIAVDTACSSSMTALHLAAQSIRAGECEIALAGGVNAILSPGTSITLSQFNMMASDGAMQGLRFRRRRLRPFRGMRPGRAEERARRPPRPRQYPCLSFGLRARSGRTQHGHHVSQPGSPA